MEIKDKKTSMIRASKFLEALFWLAIILLFIDFVLVVTKYIH